MKDSASRWLGAFFLGVVTINLFFAGLSVGMGMAGDNEKLAAFGWMLTFPCALGVVIVFRQLLLAEKRLQLCELEKHTLELRTKLGDTDR